MRESQCNCFHLEDMIEELSPRINERVRCQISTNKLNDSYRYRTVAGPLAEMNSTCTTAHVKLRSHYFVCLFSICLFNTRGQLSTVK